MVLCIYLIFAVYKNKEPMTTYTDQQKKAIDAQLRENRIDIAEQLNEVDQNSDKWWSLKETEMKISNLLIFGSYEEKNQMAQIVL